MVSGVCVVEGGGGGERERERERERSYINYIPSRKKETGGNSTPSTELLMLTYSLCCMFVCFYLFVQKRLVKRTEKKRARSRRKMKMWVVITTFARDNLLFTMSSQSIM